VSDQGGSGSSVTLDRLFRLLQDIQAEQREQRAELRDVRSLLLAQVEHGRRAERRVAELRDDLELMFKAELMGRLGNFEVGIERRLEDLEERIGTLEAGQRPS
jgi:hypothetical protein